MPQLLVTLPGDWKVRMHSVLSVSVLPKFIQLVLLMTSMAVYSKVACNLLLFFPFALFDFTA